MYCSCTPGKTFFLILATMCVFASCKTKEADAMKGSSNRNGDGSGAVRDKKEGKVIDSPVAGSWYTSNGDDLRGEIKGYLAGADLSDAPKAPGRLVGLISPHAGFRYSGGVEAHGYKLLGGRDVKRVIVMGPSHHVGFHGFALTDATGWRTPLGEVSIDTEAVKTLAGSSAFEYRHPAFTREHSVDIQIPFIQVVAPQASIVPIVAGIVDPERAREAGLAIRPLLDDETVLVASSDFTHYGPNFGYIPFSEKIEEGLKRLTDQAAEAIMKMDLNAFHRHVEDTGDTICGHAPIMTLLAAIPASAVALPLRFDTSGRMTGDWTNSVSYLSMAFFLGPNKGEFQGITVVDPKEQKMLIALARDTLKSLLAGETLPDPAKDWKEIPERLKEEFGVFVTLKKHGELRGCIGSILPVEPLFKGVIRNAVNASTRDHRFTPITLEEEPDVDIEISVLTPPKEVLDIRDIVIGRDGVILEHGAHRSVFLPQVAPEQGWDLETTLTHLSMKAGLSSDAWKSNTRFKTFQAHVFHETKETIN